MTDIKSMLPEEIEAALKEMGEPKYRAKQIFQWLSRGVGSFEEMTNLSKPLREKFASGFEIPSLTMLRKQVSKLDGSATVTGLSPSVSAFTRMLPFSLGARITAKARPR